MTFASVSRSRHQVLALKKHHKDRMVSNMVNQPTSEMSRFCRFYDMNCSIIYSIGLSTSFTTGSILELDFGASRLNQVHALIRGFSVGASILGTFFIETAMTRFMYVHRRCPWSLSGNIWNILERCIWEHLIYDSLGIQPCIGISGKYGKLLYAWLYLM